jgi:mannose/cellobiose epimerase-like protein (N-acyl-D-glucosamine 2-epimerase family)
MSKSHPDFFDPAVLKAHVAHTMAFYHPRAVDPRGGFYHFFRDDGSVYDSQTRHLVSSTRFVFDYAMAHLHFGGTEFLPLVRHGLAFLREAHRNPATGGYAWLLRRDGRASAVLDATNHCYGLAFVLLAYAHAVMAGVDEARSWLNETWELMERRFWEPWHGLYADQASADWSAMSPYRGQNANMHACEAMLAAFAATGEQRFLERAETIAWNITRCQAAHADGMIWEHYRADWTPDWDFNRDDPANLFRPWGYQPGHFTEWAKLLLQLERHEGRLARGAHWLLPTA